MLTVQNLHVRADTSQGPPLIAGLSLEVHPGEAVAIQGPSGCGKTTLLRSIAGLIDPVSGGVTLNGTTPHDMGWPDFRRRVSLVPQRPVAWDGTVASNLQRPCGFATAESAFDPDDAKTKLKCVGLNGVMGTQAATLSEGERQRVCLVRALLARPDFVLLDEPTSALDGESAGKVEALLSHERDRHNLGVLVATHAGGFAERLCTRRIDLSGYIPTPQAVRQAVADA